MGIDWSRIVPEEPVNGTSKVVSTALEMTACTPAAAYNSADVLYVTWLFLLGR